MPNLTDRLISVPWKEIRNGDQVYLICEENEKPWVIGPVLVVDHVYNEVSLPSSNGMSWIKISLRAGTRVAVLRDHDKRLAGRVYCSG